MRVALVDTNVTAYSATHEFLSDINAAVVATSGVLTGKTVTDGTFNCDDYSFTGVSGAQCEALVYYVDTGVAGTSRLVAYKDTGVTNLPVTPNGGDINITVNASGVFAL